MSEDTFRAALLKKAQLFTFISNEARSVLSQRQTGVKRSLIPSCPTTLSSTRPASPADQRMIKQVLITVQKCNSAKTTNKTTFI